MELLNHRSYQTEDDFWRIREFLRQVFLLNNRHMFSWPVVRWDYWRWHGILNLGDGALERDVFLWETKDQQIAAVLNCEEPGQVFLQVHPSMKSVQLEENMISLAEERMRVRSRKGDFTVWIWSDAADTQRLEILSRRGFSHVSPDESQWWRSLDQPIPEHPVADGYAIRSLGDSSELPSRSWASWRAFHSNEPDDKYDPDPSWYLNIQAAPMYRRDLDLVAIAPAGDVAAFVTTWYDDVTRCGVFEPVGSMPEHQRRGLARSLLYESMRRLKKMGATLAMTSGYTPHANSVYQSVLSPDHDVCQPWEKRWPG